MANQTWDDVQRELFTHEEIEKSQERIRRLYIERKDDDEIVRAVKPETEARKD